MTEAGRVHHHDEKLCLGKKSASRAQQSTYYHLELFYYRLSRPPAKIY